MNNRSKRMIKSIFVAIVSLLLCFIICFGITGCGSEGPQGPVGPAGAQGDKGDKGDKGDGYVPPVDPKPEPADPLTEGSINPVGSMSGFLDKGSKFYLDYSTKEELQDAERELAIKIAAEGDVLLKNENDVLPLSAETSRVSLFGSASYDLVHGGGGSGAGSLGTNGYAAATLTSSVAEVGWTANPTLHTLYTTYPGSEHELPESVYNNTIVSTYKSYDDAAIITISRVGAEDGDLLSNNVTGHSNPDDHECMLKDNEEALIRHVKKHFDKVIVLINSSNVMQITELAEEKTNTNLGVDAILWIGNPGNDGIVAVGRILSGAVNPSGKTSDVWESDFTKGPTWTNFSEQSQNKDAGGKRMDAIIYDDDGTDTGFRSVEYREDIYLGYRYYETLAYDMNKTTAGSGDAWYEEQVVYPFGFGLSYTTFDWSLAPDIAETANITAANQTVTVKVIVTNTGNAAGKDVVQLYSNPPYVKGGIEKASANLVGFAKTKLLAPGQSDTVIIRIAAQDLASFDWNNRTKNNHDGYELGAGDYILSANKDSHTPVVSVTRTVVTEILCKTDLTTGEEIKPVFTGDYSSMSDTLEENMISRETGLAQPKIASIEDRTYDDDTLLFLSSQIGYEVWEDNEDQPWFVEEVPDQWTQAVSHETDYSDMTIPFGKMAGTTFTDPSIDENNIATSTTDNDSAKWDAFMNQFTWEELCDLVSYGGGTVAMPSIEVAASSYTDGPMQRASGQFWPCAPIVAATFNAALAGDQGRMVGNENILAQHIGGWAGPAVNIHRSPLSGRNFEYYSEDGYLSGVFGAAVTAGATEKGLICYVKHAFLNDQEKYRNSQGGVLTFASEQAIREIYAKPFEAVAKDGHTVGYMSSFNRIGLWNAATNYAMQKLLIRKEWQFKGRSITDMWVKDYNPINLLVRAGDEQPLGTGKNFPNRHLTYGEWSATDNLPKLPANAAEKTAGTNSMLSPTHYFAVRTAAQRVLFSTVNSIASKNCIELATGHMYFAQHMTSSQNLIIEGLDDARDIEIVAGTLPDGLTATGSVISGSATEVGDFEITVSGITNNWASFTADVIIHVVNPLEVNIGGVNMENADNNTVTVKSGTSFSAEFISNYLEYGQKYTFASIPSSMRVTDVVGASGGPGGYFGSTVQVINLYQEFEDMDECKDTTKNSLYRGNVSLVPRNEDSTAGDMPTVDVNNTDAFHAAFEYSFSHEGTLPAGLSFEKTYQEVRGLSFGAYEAEKSYVLSGSTTAVGQYEITVDLLVPVGVDFMGWIGKPWFGGVALMEISRTITINVVA